MAQVWKPRIVVDDSLFKLPEVAQLADEATSSVEEVAGPLLKVWLWVQGFNDCGSVPFNIKYIDVIAGWTDFGRHMQAAGLVEPTGPRACRFMFWSEWVGRERAIESQKVAKIDRKRSVLAGQNDSKTTAKKEPAKKPSSPPSLLPDEPAILTFPCNGEPAEWRLVQSQIDHWSKLFEGVDVLAELKKSLAWIEANGKKTARGYQKFCVSWLSRSNNSGRAVSNSNHKGRAIPASTQKALADQLAEELRQKREQKGGR